MITEKITTSLIFASLCCFSAGCGPQAAETLPEDAAELESEEYQESMENAGDLDDPAE